MTCMVMCACNPNTWLVVAAEGSGVQGQPQKYTVFEDNLSYKRPCHQKREGEGERDRMRMLAVRN